MKSGFARQCKGNASCSSDRIGWVQGNFLFKETTMSDLSPITLHHGNEVLNKLRSTDHLIHGLTITQDSGFEIQVSDWLIVTVYQSSDVYIEVNSDFLYTVSRTMELIKLSEALKEHTVYWSITDNTLGSALMLVARQYSECVDYEEQLNDFMRPVYSMRPQE
jgi:hypothetical protein